MSEEKPANPRLRVAHLNPRQPTPFALSPTGATRDRIAGQLGLSALPSLVFTGQIVAKGTEDWELTGRLEAVAVQDSVISLEEVSTSVFEEIRRLYTPRPVAPDTEEVEMLDDEVEELGQVIDLEALMIEELELALPLYPRLDGEELDVPESDERTGEGETRRPFAGLADLLKKDS